MTPEDGPTFGIIDYFVMVSLLVMSMGIGVLMSFRGNKTPEDYLFGNRSFGPVPIAMSLLTSFVSSISLLGFSGEAYAYGVQFSLFAAGVVPALLFCNYITLPVIFPLRLTSVNEYIEMRFKSKPLQRVVMLISCCQGILYAGIYLYAPTLAITSVVPVSTKTCVLILGTVCTVYSTIGGIKAVVWTDVLQLGVVLLGSVAILTIGCVSVGGIMNVWTLAKEGGRLNVFNMNPGIYERHTLPNSVLYGFSYFVAMYGVSQINAQRMACVPTIVDAKKVLILNALGTIAVNFLVFTSGLMCYATYVGCDPLILGKIKKSDQILAFYVFDKLKYIVGLPGLFAAILISGSLSSVSSVISALVSMIWKDCFLHFQLVSKATPPMAAVINKVLSVIVGSMLTGMALLASRALNLLDIALAVSGASIGPLLGVFLLGLCFPKCNVYGAWGGLLTSWLLLAWMTVGGLLYRTKAVPLPLSIESCRNFGNSTSDLFLGGSFSANETTYSQLSLPEPQFIVKWIYNTSTNLYPVIGPIVCIVVGLLTSLITGSQKLIEVSPTLITPCIRRFYFPETSGEK